MTGEAEPGAGSEWARRRNTARVLRALRRAGPASRVELAASTGLAKATVGVIVAALEEARAVAEAPEPPEPSRSRGRPARPVALVGDRFLALGLELNVDYVAAVLLDLAGVVRRHETRAVETGQEPVEVLAGLVEEVLAPVHADADLCLVGAVVAVPGLVRGDDDRTVAWAPNLAIAGDGVAARLQPALGDCALQVSNDADCAAYAEAHHGAATDSESLLYLTGTVGVGAGIVDAGQLVRGGSGFAGEVGHVPIGDPTARCGCGRLGCWEASIGLHAMLRATGSAELGTPLASAEAVASRAASDPALREVLARLGRDLGTGLAVLAAVVDPTVVVLGGYFVPLGELVLEPARAELDQRLVESLPRPELRVGALGIEAAALGAAERAFAGVFAGDRDLFRVEDSPVSR